MPSGELVPKQERSRETLKRLLQATAAVLEERGLERATIPLIAARAGVTPGAVYRRFRDKDALLRTLLLETLRSVDKRNGELLVPELAGRLSLPELIRKVVGNTLQGYRKSSGLMRALTQFARSHPNAAFKKKVDELEVRNFERVVRFVLSKRSEIGHPDADQAVPFALMLMALALREMVILDVLSPAWSPLLPKNDAELTHELTRTILNYLECGTSSSRKPKL